MRMKQPYILKYRQAGKRHNTTRWTSLPIGSTREAVEMMNKNSSTMFLPAFVETAGWRPETVAILG